MTAMNPQPPPFPHDDVHSALGEHPEGAQALRGLQTELASEKPDSAAVQRHVGVLSSIPGVRPLVENWVESPATQHWLQVLGNIGL